jgi:D-3-phosphoglycerate dehydrogenase / 2-oxoglutarate reductase
VPNRVKVLMAEPDRFSPRALAMLGQFAEVRLAAGDYDSLMAGAGWADVLWVRLRHHIDAQVLAAAPGLRAIVSPTTGLNHIDLNEAARRGVEVLSLRGETEFLRNVRATAELTIGLMLALLRRLPSAMAHVQDGGWDRDRFRGNELAGMTVGIAGYGRLGTLVARYLQAFDANVLVADPAVSPAALAPGLTLVTLDRLLAESSLISLHVNLSPETEGMIGAAEFGKMKTGAWFVNTARGELVDEPALISALESGQLSGAAVDVLCGEQTRPGLQPLVALAQRRENLLITPHIGGCTVESMEKTELFMTNKLEAAVGSGAR